MCDSFLRGDDTTDLLRSIVKVLVVIYTEILLLSGNHLLCDIRVCSLEAQDDWLGELVLIVSSNDRTGQCVTSEDSSEDVDENCLDFSIVIKKFECFFKLGVVSTTTYI